MARHAVTVIPGDGIGPECVGAATAIVDATGVGIDWIERHAGERVFRQGIASGVPPETIDSIAQTRVVLKGPLGTPVGFGEKSANVTLRKLFETFANIRPVRELPGVTTPFSGQGIDLVVVRENVEDLYAGIEHMQTPDVAQCLKLISAKGCEKIVRTAFEYARAEGRGSVACATKANIMKLPEGLMKRTFEQVSKQYPDIQAHHVIVDNCAHQLVRTPEQFEVIATSNMNGDILSDLTSGLVGGLGFAPGANLGDEVAIFEAIQGTAPNVVGKDPADPTAVLLSATLLLRHLDEFAVARAVENALVATYESGLFTQGVAKDGSVSTSAFADAVISRLGRRAERWRPRDHRQLRLQPLDARRDYVHPATRTWTGVGVFLESPDGPEALGPQLEALVEGTPLKLKMISNRGTRVYPATGGMTDCVDHWRCRFVRRDATTVQATLAFALLWQQVQSVVLCDQGPGRRRAPRPCAPWPAPSVGRWRASARAAVRSRPPRRCGWRRARARSTCWAARRYGAAGAPESLRGGERVRGASFSAPGRGEAPPRPTAPVPSCRPAACPSARASLLQAPRPTASPAPRTPHAAP